RGRVLERTSPDDSRTRATIYHPAVSFKRFLCLARWRALTTQPDGPSCAIGTAGPPGEEAYFSLSPAAEAKPATLSRDNVCDRGPYQQQATKVSAITFRV